MTVISHFRRYGNGPLRCGLASSLSLSLWLPAAGARVLAESNPNLNAQLLVGARHGDVAKVQAALDHGAVPNSRNRLGKTPLLIACEKGNRPIAELMLRRGGDIDEASIEGVTPLLALPSPTAAK